MGEMTIDEAHGDIVARLRLSDRVGDVEREQARQGAHIDELTHDVRVQLPAMESRLMEAIKNSRPNFVGWAAVLVGGLGTIVGATVALVAR